MQQATPPHSTEFRALTRYDRLPNDHVTFAITDAAAAPHLKRGEFAVIDTADRDLQHGELYLVQYGAGFRYVKQATECEFSVRHYGKNVRAWMLGDLAGWRDTGSTVLGVSVFAGLSDGPYAPLRLRKMLIGRVIGYAALPLGRRLHERAA